MRIALDFAGSDTGPEVFMEAVSIAVKQRPYLRFLLLVPTNSYFQIPSGLSLYVEKCLAEEVVEMWDSPVLALREKPKATLFLGLDALKNSLVEACISTGNTGAIVAGAHRLLPLFRGIKRVSLLANIPLTPTPLTLIDAGASLLCRVSHLMQFAELGVLYQKIRFGVIQPKVGLLNIGQEAEKGPIELKKAYQMLSWMHEQKKIIFYGNVEANQVFDGRVNVLVTPGFSGNLFLKTAEGVLHVLRPHLLASSLSSSTLNLQHFTDPAQISIFLEQGVGSGLVMGLKSLLLKCHGRSTVEAILHAIEEAYLLFEKNLTQKMCEACWK